MIDSEKRMRRAFEELRMKVPPKMLTDLVYKIVPREDRAGVEIDHNVLVGFVDTTSRFEVNHVNQGERALKVRIINSLYETINLLQDCIESLE